MVIIRAIIGIPIIIWIIVGGVYFYLENSDWEEAVYKPLIQRVEESRQQFDIQRNRNQLAEDFEKQKQEKLALIQDLSRRLNESRDELPRDPDLPTILKLLADISDSTGLEFSRFEPAGEAKDNFVVVTRLKVTLKGSYTQIMSFLDAVSNLRRIVSARSVSFQNPIINGQTSLLNAEAILVTYHIEGGG